MWKLEHRMIGGTIFLLCLAGGGFGYVTSNAWLLSAGAVGVCYALARITCRGWSASRKGTAEVHAVAAQRPPEAASHKPVDPDDTDGLIEQMLAQGRFALLLRSQVAQNLSKPQFVRALEALEEAVALVPDGEVVLGRIDDALDNGKLDDKEIVSHRGRVIDVERFFLDRYPVTNRQYYEFVAAGGYEQMSLWDKQMWTAVLDMVDRTGMPGPRYWRNGCFLPGEENHPVVGVSWYEANAYARWLGKRLPSDAEWVKAGSWPVALSPTSRVQRKYPWGDSMDRRCANLWGSGEDRTVGVDQFSPGVSVGGVYQLIGNVWEWTSGNYRSKDHPMGDLLLGVPMKSIRGGAFDTYFDNQATCQFQSGENPLGRRHNIGFRCTVGVCDLMLSPPATAQPQQTSDEQSPATEEAPV